jgi:hypothetical protein
VRSQLLCTLREELALEASYACHPTPHLQKQFAPDWGGGGGQTKLTSPPPACSFFQSSSFNKWKLNAYYVPGTVLSGHRFRRLHHGDRIVPLTAGSET